MNCPSCKKEIDDTQLPWNLDEEDEVRCDCGHAFIVRVEYKYVRHVVICQDCCEPEEDCYCEDEHEGGAA